MKIFKLFISSLPLSKSSFINYNKKICKDCKHFIGNTTKCSKFGDVDFVSGTVNYDYAESVRLSNNKCE